MYSKNIIILVLAFSVIQIGCKAVHENTLLSSEIESNDSEVFEKWSAGEKAWNSSCVSCHSSIDTSLKRGASYSKIISSLATIPQMKNINISKVDIENIVFALKHKRPSLSPDSGDNTGGQYGQKYSCVDQSQRGLSAKNMSRHSYGEIKNILQDLFGSGLYSEVSTEVSFLPLDLYKHSEQFIPVLSAEYFEAMIKISDKLSEIAIVDQSFIQKYSSCSELVTVVCLREFLTNFAARAFKHPLEDSDLNDLLSQYENDSNVTVQVLLMSLLMRPEFAMKYERGVEVGDRYKLNSYDIASRISFRTIGSIPDEVLWQAAKEDKLTNLVEVEKHVSRLIDTERGRNEVTGFFREWMEVEGQVLSSATAAHQEGLNLNALYSSALLDFDKFVEHIVFEKQGRFLDLFLDPSIFPTHADLASVYDSSVWTAGAPLASASGHQGLLLRPATLIGGSNFTPIIERGVHVRRELLCDSLPIPSQEVISARDDEQDPDELNHTIHPNRDVVKNLTKSASCMGCHTKINPLGFALEDFDSLGRFQSKENVYDISGEIDVVHDVDSRAIDPIIEDGAAVVLNGAPELNREIANSSKIKSCFSKQLTERAYRRAIASEDECVMSDKESLVRDPEVSVKEILIKNISNEDIFWRSK